MRRRSHVTALFSLTALAALAASAFLTAPGAATADVPPGQQLPGHYQFAVIGDIPYGADQIAKFPAWIAEINAADPELTLHVGDIKNGSSRCDDPYYAMIRERFDSFVNPLIYTPGDNEWTDCHRANNGAYAPLGRLDLVRDTFFPEPGTTLGTNPMRVSSQADQGLPENVSFRRQGVQFAVLHVVGSNDDLQPWTGIGNAAPTAEQVAEEQHRMAGDVALVRSAFASARQKHDRAVALFLQADMFDPTVPPATGSTSAFTSLVRTLAAESAAFDGEVYLFNGDSHIFNSDHPLSAGSPWVSWYGVTDTVTNLERVTVDGSNNNYDWLHVTITRPGAEHVLTWERVPYQH